MRIFTLVLVLCIVSCTSKPKEKVKETASNQVTTTKTTPEKTMEKGSIHQFTVKDIAGNDFKLADLKGKKVLIVNTASECGLTPQYEQLQDVYETFKDKNFTIVGFPANNFGAQEPGSDQQIAKFCKANYGVTFPMMSKISVKGSDMHEVYQFLTQKSQNGLQNSEVAWNFQKYLINENGELEKVIAPQTLPNDESIISWIEGK
ncbi:glutathione peroxidase [Kordia algicida OT-1]|uniref:Glutathione peroxidase n=1 Tax=Kordia algicida OT-1 TaxID=391587 RepID=A9DVX8_9FLAO|nr:glutathione peroxidase [Kordia algicida]EDP96481.1 putative glutathione peroxidase [Kordia algicida OT-1]